MCGIAGMLGVPERLARAAAPRMLSAMRHRGPDASGTLFVPDPKGAAPPAVLLHARLAILDPSPAGLQPMSDRTQPGETPNHIVFNGEIFNFKEFHHRLASEGRPCRSRCDTEVILNSYRLYGRECVAAFRGMFAWCLLDTGRAAAWLCRDRLGMKPLYLAHPTSGGLMFASELRTLLAAGPDLLPPRANRAAIEGYLSQGEVIGDDSLIENVRLLGAGESVSVDWSGSRRESNVYWRIPFSQAGRSRFGPGDRDAAVRELGVSLREAVRLQMISDVPLALFLSGGVDSSAIAAVATEIAGAKLQTVSIGFEQAEFDESDAAADVAAALGTCHLALRLTGESVLADLSGALAAVDQPTVDGFNVYFVSQAARGAGLTVALSGLGGDELFGGYASFVDVPRAMKWRRRLGWLGPVRHLLGYGLRGFGGRRTAKIAEAICRAPDHSEMYFLRRELFPTEARRALHSLPPASHCRTGVPLAVLADLQRMSDGLDDGNRVSLFEMSAYMRHMLLRDADVFSMAHGLELRAPLLDHRLVELVAGMPGTWKRSDPRPKPLLLDAVGPRLPDRVRRSPKRGFAFPWDAWLRGPLRDRSMQVAEEGDVWSSLGLSVDAIRRLLRRFLAGDRSISALQILAFVVLCDFTARHNLRISD